MREDLEWFNSNVSTQEISRDLDCFKEKDKEKDNMEIGRNGVYAKFDNTKTYKNMLQRDILKMNRKRYLSSNNNSKNNTKKQKTELELYDAPDINGNQDALKSIDSVNYERDMQ